MSEFISGNAGIIRKSDVFSKEEVAEKVVLDGLGKKLLKFWVDDGL